MQIIKELSENYNLADDEAVHWAAELINNVDLRKSSGMKFRTPM